ncbi:MAG TPA: hypothetical protein VFW73_10550 [Lacipirellulaceae bacterium]|nr:hypothetical protein [Lacipirellulaceae bacterium]
MWFQQYQSTSRFGCDQGSAAINSSGGGGIVKNVSFSDITMTNVDHPIIINSWYDGGDHYGSNELSDSSLHNPLQFDATTPGDPTVLVDQNNNTDLQPFYDNICYSNITATGGTENVATICGRNSVPVSPSDPLRARSTVRTTVCGDRASVRRHCSWRTPMAMAAPMAPIM